MLHNLQSTFTSFSSFDFTSTNQQYLLKHVRYIVAKILDLIEPHFFFLASVSSPQKTTVSHASNLMFTFFPVDSETISSCILEWAGQHIYIHRAEQVKMDQSLIGGQR